MFHIFANNIYTVGIHLNGLGQIDSNEYVQSMFFIDKINGFG